MAWLLGEGDEAVFERWTVDAQVEGRSADGDEVGTDVGQQRPVPSTWTSGPWRRTASTPGRARRGRTSRSASVKRTVEAPPSSSTIAAGVPSATTRPWSMTTMRSHSRSASSTSWVTSTTVVPGVADVAHDVPRVAAGHRVEVLRQLVEEHDLRAGRRGRGRRTAAGARRRRGRRTAAAGWSPSCHSSTSSPVGRGVGCRAANSAQRLADAHPLRAGRRPAAGRRCAAAAGLPPTPGRGRGTRTRPASARRSPWRISTVVVLPAPFVPRRPNSSPRWTVKWMPLTTSVVAVALDEAVDLHHGFPGRHEVRRRCCRCDRHGRRSWTSPAARASERGRSVDSAHGWSRQLWGSTMPWS